MTEALQKRWLEEGGYREVLKIAIPLILSTGSMVIQHFVDRMFLSWHSAEAVASATPAGLISYTLMSVFVGTATYVNTFVAQYSGAGRNKRIGPSVWQGLYFAVFAGLAILPLYPIAPKIFSLAGHAPEIQKMEIQYFQILIFSGFAATASSAMAGFFTGREKTNVVMWVTFASTAVNIILDYALIFGNWGFPCLDIRGAALATVISQYSRIIIYVFLMMRPHHRKKYWTLKGWKPERELFIRLVRFGFPNGLHIFLDLTGYTLLIMLVGRLGTVPLAATNITFNINHLVFLPLMGTGMAVSVLVGRRLGENRPWIAERTTWSTIHMTTVFILSLAVIYVLAPGILLFPYAAKANPEQFAPIARTAAHLLKFVAVYAIFDMMNFIFAASIKGAGDTRFVMIVSVSLSWVLMVFPSFLTVLLFHKGLYTVWIFHTLNMIVLGIVFLRRFQGGKWKSMRVIESRPPLPGGEPRDKCAET